MKGKKKIKIDLGFATFIVGVLAFIGVIIGIFKEDIFTCIGSHNLNSSSDDFESGANNLSSSDSNSNSDGSDSSSSVSGNNSSNGSESNKKNLFTNEKGRVELFDGRSGVAYIYKGYLDENPIGLINEYGHTKIIGWSIILTYQNKSFSFNIDCSQNNDEDHPYCSTQYDINEESQNDLFNNPIVSYDTNGDLKIEFEFENIPFDLRDSSDYIIIRNICIGI